MNLYESAPKLAVGLLEIKTAYLAVKFTVSVQMMLNFGIPKLLTTLAA